MWEGQGPAGPDTARCRAVNQSTRRQDRGQTYNSFCPQRVPHPQAESGILLVDIRVDHATSVEAGLVIRAVSISHAPGRAAQVCVREAGTGRCRWTPVSTSVLPAKDNCRVSTARSGRAAVAPQGRGAVSPSVPVLFTAPCMEPCVRVRALIPRRS